MRADLTIVLKDAERIYSFTNDGSTGSVLVTRSDRENDYTWTKAAPATAETNCDGSYWCDVVAFDWEGPGQGTYKITMDNSIQGDRYLDDFSSDEYIAYFGKELTTLDEVLAMSVEIQAGNDEITAKYVLSTYDDAGTLVSEAEIADAVWNQSFD